MSALGLTRHILIFRNRPLMTLMLGHFTVDTFAGLLPVLYPGLVAQYGLDFKTVGLVTLAYSGASSLVQPAFGWIADRRGTRQIGLALLWTAASFSLIGFAPSFPILLAIAALAGIGSGMYHPLGAMNAAAVIEDPRQRNTAMSVYVTGGTFGVAMGPLLGILLFSLFGVRGTALLVIPGAVIAAWMLLEMRTSASFRPRRDTATIPVRSVQVLPMLAILGVMMARQWTSSSLQAFIPTWYASLGYPPGFYGALATTLILASAVGAIGAGTLADRFGRKTILIVSLFATIPTLLLFVQFQGPIAFVSVALVGLSGASTAPLLIVMAQQLMVGRTGVATGMILGIGFVTGAIGVPITGALADSIGFPAAFRLQVIVIVLTILLAQALPSDVKARAFDRGPKQTA